MAAPGTVANLVAPGEDAINRKIEDLTRQLKELAPSVMESILPLIQEISDAADAAQAAADAANAAVEDLAVQVARIDALVATQVDGNTGTASASPTLNTTPTGYAAITFTVPSGYTRAQVMGVSAMYAGGIVASVLRTEINGSSGPDMYAFTNAAYANATAANAASLSGLSGGGTFTVQSVANTTTSSTSAVIITAATVMWLR